VLEPEGKREKHAHAHTHKKKKNRLGYGAKTVFTREDDDESNINKSTAQLRKVKRAKLLYGDYVASS
jgi:hypothetical protein